jgi:hypothetical protein
MWIRGVLACRSTAVFAAAARSRCSAPGEKREALKVEGYFQGLKRRA